MLYVMTQTQIFDTNPEGLRILFVIEAPYPWLIGGAERHALRLAQELVKKGCRCMFVTPYPRAWKNQTVKEQNQLIHCLPIPLRHEHQFFKRLFYLRLCCFLVAQRENYDIVDMHLLATTAFISTIIKFLRKASLLKINTIERWERLKLRCEIPHLRTVMSRSLSDTDGFLVMNHYLESILQRDGIPKAKLHHIPNGIPIAIRRNDKNQLRLDLDLQQTPVIILYAGRFVTQKNVPLLIHSFSEVAQKAPWAQLVLLGDGPSMAEIRNLVNNLGLSDRIDFRGIVSNVVQYMSACDIFVLPSNIEGCPNALLEAMGCGMACVVTRFAGADEIIVDQHNGILVQKNDVAGMTIAIQNLVANPQWRQQLGQLALQTIAARFDITHIAELYRQTYRQLYTNRTDRGRIRNTSP